MASLKWRGETAVGTKSEYLSEASGSNFWWRRNGGKGRGGRREGREGWSV